MSDKAVLVTGAAGFIGFHVARQLLSEGRDVVGLDNLNNYYDPALKQSRLSILREQPAIPFRASRSCRSSLDGVAVRETPISRSWSTSRPRRACVIRSTILTPMSTPILRALSMFWRAAATRLSPSGICIILVGLRRQYQATIFSRRQDGSSGQSLRGDQEGQRTDGSFL